MSAHFEIQSYRRTYTVDFVDQAKAQLGQLLKPGDRVIADKNVWALYPGLQEAIGGEVPILVDPCEPAKSYEGVIPVIEQLLVEGFTKSNRLIAVGGGVVQDVTAFSASILLRGVDWIFFPTNLLAQCDSCIGSKTSINFKTFKNQLGGFYPPQAIYIDLAFLETVPEREIFSGLGEMMHYFLVSGEQDFSWVVERLDRALTDPEVLQELVHRSLAIKKEMIERDEFDQGPRNVFNYGHSFGHALESATKYAVPHGIAVSYGMDLANLISVQQGLISMELRNRVRPSLASICQNVPTGDVPMDAYFLALSRDKKNEGSLIKVILTRGLGDMFKTTLTLDEPTRNLISRYFAEGGVHHDR